MIKHHNVSTYLPIERYSFDYSFYNQCDKIQFCISIPSVSSSDREPFVFGRNRIIFKLREEYSLLQNIHIFSPRP